MVIVVTETTVARLVMMLVSPSDDGVVDVVMIQLMMTTLLRCRCRRRRS